MTKFRLFFARLLILFTNIISVFRKNKQIRSGIERGGTMKYVSRRSQRKSVYFQRNGKSTDRSRRETGFTKEEE